MGVAENPDRINHHLRSHAFLLTQIVPTVLLGNATTFTFYNCFVIGNVQNVFGLNIYSVIMAIRKANNGTARCKLWETLQFGSGSCMRQSGFRLVLQVMKKLRKVKQTIG